MRVAICIGQSSIGGVGTSTYILAIGMRKAGHQADILATDWLLGPDYERARRDDWPVEAICSGERWLRRRLEITLARLSTYDVVINNHSTEALLIIPALPKHVVRLSVIRSTNNAIVSGAALNSRWFDAVVGLTPAAKHMLEKAGVECQVRLIPNASRIEGKQFPVLGESVKILFLGRLTDIDKNILILPEIAVECRKRGLEFKITIAGDGPDRQLLEEKVSELGVADSFTMLGTVPRELVEQLLGDSHFMLLPSNYEGLSLSLIEAMATGCIPITSDIPSNTYGLGESALELQAPVKNAEAYAERILKLAEDPERYKILQQRLRRHQRENFTPEVTVNGYLSLLTQLKAKHNEAKFTPIALTKLDLPSYYRRRCTRLWWWLQKCRYGFHDYQLKRKAQQ